ncbi:hypothetical protein [Nocardia cyriacigeorgica]|nr:hypothetical protein [Nocardia cyriacigeorgica]
MSDFMSPSALDRRTTAAVSITERQLYLELNGSGFSTEITEHALA